MPDLEHMGRCYLAGVDLGQRSDHTVIVVVEGVRVIRGTDPTFDNPNGVQGEDHFDIVHFSRLPLGTPWSTIIGEIIDVADRYRPYYLHVDETGLGGPIVERLFTETMRAGLRRPYPVTFSAQVKKDLVGGLEILVDERRLHARPDIPLGRDFADELRTFGYSITDAGNVSYNATGSAHDDFISALGLAVYPYAATRRRLGSTARVIRA